MPLFKKIMEFILFRWLFQRLTILKLQNATRNNTRRHGAIQIKRSARHIN
jgi:hypothetical protein